MPEINVENLEMLKKLQLMFKKVLGELKHGDKVLFKGREIDFYCQDCIDYKIFSENLYEGSLLIPTLEELWGLMDWESWDLSNNEQGIIMLEGLASGMPVIVGDIYTTLLKALCSQEGL